MLRILAHKDLRILTILLVVLGLLLVVTTIRGAFIIDEINYMVSVIGLREGRLTVPGTDGLSPSKELVYFDPEPFNRTVLSTPVVSLAPPLYAPLALPFFLFGWRGLAFLNTLSFLLSAFVVFLFVRRRATELSSAWIAMALFVLGGYSLEYAQGVWPHMLSVFLCVTAVYAVSFVWEGGKPVFAILGGFLIGLACGVREQNIFLAGCLGLTVMFWGSGRVRQGIAFLSGIAPPLLASATLNYFKLGVFYPTPKAAAYSQFVTSPVKSGTWMKPIEVFWVKIVDFSAFAHFQDPNQFVDYAREPSTGAFLVAGIVKKALLQSSPWIALAILLCVAIWMKDRGVSQPQKNILRALSLLILSALVMFSMAGFRMDGLSFNQRYLLEIVPMAAIVVALSIDGKSVPVIDVVRGLLFAGLIFALVLIAFSAQSQHVAILDVPLGLGLVLILAWILKHHFQSLRIFGVVLGLCIGWSLMVQTIDLITSRRIRTTNSAGLDSLNAAIPNHAALFTFWGAQKSIAGPMQLSKDVVILDAWGDIGKDAPLLARELCLQQRRVFILGTGMPSEIIADIRGSDSVAVRLKSPFLIYEFVEKDKSASPSSGSLPNDGHRSLPNHE